MTTQIVDGALDVTPTIEDWQKGRLLTLDGTRTNNGTKGNPSLVADIFGDWREELLVRTTDSSAIRVYLSTEVTNRKLYTLMHDVQYRTGVARQSTTYNQPSYTSFYFASDTDWSKVPVPTLNTPGLAVILEQLLTDYKAKGELSGKAYTQLNSSLQQALKHQHKGNTKQALKSLDKLIDQISKEKSKNISPEAAKNLTKHALLLKDSWT